ncbi:hypothetical protein B7494_g5004 [Chlorociboria aeruginascens]|nr:hypothetical protein B7494_g5004 [Chlorociboria aeruginascens]
MSSVRNVLVALGSTALALLQLSSGAALPHQTPVNPGGPEEPTDCVADGYGTPTIPVSGDATELPTTNLTLQYIALGRGIQNYSCSAVGAIPVSIGAIATLFDATQFATSNIDAFNNLPTTAVYHDLPAAGADFILDGVPPLSVLGNHFFAADTTPTFELTAVSKSLRGAKTADIKAPASANIGPAGTGAVDWLQLVNKDTSVGLSMVYRVSTAGGSATPTCNGTSIITFQYSAAYWFYD